MAGVGMYVLAIDFVLKAVGLEAPEGSILAFVNGVIAITALFLWVFGQMKRKDLRFGLVRK